MREFRSTFFAKQLEISDVVGIIMFKLFEGASYKNVLELLVVWVGLFIGTSKYSSNSR